MMKFSDACISAINMARHHECVFYVYSTPSLWDVSSVYKSGWLFKAYPGGRKILSLSGKDILNKEKKNGTTSNGI